MQDAERVTKDNFFIYHFDYEGTTKSLDILDQIRIQHLSNTEKNKLIPLKKKFKNIFYLEGSDLSFTNVVKYSIRTINDISSHLSLSVYP